MKKFLQQVAKVYYENEFKDLNVSNFADYAFVFPNRRAGLFFKKYLADMFDHAVFSPSIFTISEFFALHTKLRRKDDVSLLFTLYECYKEVCEEFQKQGDCVEVKPFAQFMSWGEMLLSDFNDIDNEHADAKRVFTNVSDLKDIDALYAGVDEKILDVLREFWGSVLPVEDSKTKGNFVASWKLVYPLYEKFTARLRGEKCGYEGLIFRDAVDGLENKTAFKRIVFAGFNALNYNERALLDFYKKSGKADFYWDSESIFLEDDYAGKFVREFKDQFLSRYTLDLKKEEAGKGEIELIPVASAVGQAFEMNRILRKKKYNGVESAVVLPDETMLLPILHNIPNEIENVNVTMGYALSLSQMHSLVHNLLVLQENVKQTKDGEVYCYFKYVMPVLNNPLMRETYVEIEQIVRDVNEKKLYNIYASDFVDGAHELLNGMLEVSVNPIEYLLAVVKNIKTNSEVEKTLIINYGNLLRQLGRNLKSTALTFEGDGKDRKDALSVLRHLIDQMVSAKRVAFEGEPLSGLQVIGLLETRSLDFDNLIIPSMNEEIYPRRQTAVTIIPYNLRKAFGLPTYEKQDKVSAYYFFRLISRATNVHILYDTRTDGSSTGELSRFVQQLEMLYGKKIEKRELPIEVTKGEAGEVLSVKKTLGVVKKVRKYAARDKKGFSASALKTYMECPLRFYLGNIEHISEADDLKEEVEVNVLGSIFHLAMEILYEKYVGKEVTKDTIKALRSGAAEAVKIAFNVEYLKIGRKSCENEKEYKALSEEFRKKNLQGDVMKTSKGEFVLVEPEGQYKLTTAVIKRYVEKTLDYDEKIAPFRYKASEEEVYGTIDIPVENGGIAKVNFHGFVDRVHEKDGVNHIVDYKTGSDKLHFDNVEALFGENEKKHNGAAFQTLFYSYVKSKNGMAAENMQPNVYKIKEIGASYNPQLEQGEKKNEKKCVERYADVQEGYEGHLLELLKEILSAEGEFAQAKNKGDDTCKYCSFVQMCGVEVKKYD